MTAPNTFTAFCQLISEQGMGTTWIGHFVAPAGSTPDDIKEQAIETCMGDWEFADPEDIHLLGIACGDVIMTSWCD
jgi:hypothetical protein